MTLTRPNAARVIVPRYHMAPAYGPRGLSGGTRMEVVLGPAAAHPVNYGTGTSMLSIPRLMQPLHQRDPGKWIAGHLLNDNLGGSGTDDRNLTPLTQTANKRHSGIETRVKEMCDIADLYHRNNPRAAFWYGVRYSVEVSALTFGDFAPYDRVASHITVTARVVTIDKQTGVETPVDNHNQYVPRYNIGPTVIDNDDSHLA
jgi:hypothetical protein